MLRQRPRNEIRRDTWRARRASHRVEHPGTCTHQTRRGKWTGDVTSRQDSPDLVKAGLFSISRQWPGLWLTCRADPLTEEDCACIMQALVE